MNPIAEHKLVYKSEAGLSLIELMIALTIGLVLLVGVTTLIVQQSITRDELEKSSRQIENGRYATQLLHDDIEHAGFYGQYPTAPPVPGALPNPCMDTGAAALTQDMGLPIQGYNSPAASPIPTCLPAADFVPGTDILVIRRADTGMPITVAGAAATPGQMYMQTSSANVVVNTGTGATATTFPLYLDTANLQAAPLRPYLVHIYFISPCSVPAGGATDCTGPNDDNGHPIPTLKRAELSTVGGVTTFVTTPLVEGIENMQLEYGVDNDGDGYPDVYSFDPGTAAGWVNVMAVRINLLARNIDPAVGYTDTKNYTLGATAGALVVGPFACAGAFPQPCNYKRHLYMQVVRAVNPSARRAQQ